MKLSKENIEMVGKLSKMEGQGTRAESARKS